MDATFSIYYSSLASGAAELGVKPELEIYDTGHLEACMRLYDEGLLATPLQFGIVLGVRGGMLLSTVNCTRSTPNVSIVARSGAWQFMPLVVMKK